MLGGVGSCDSRIVWTCEGMLMAPAYWKVVVVVIVVVVIVVVVERAD